MKLLFENWRKYLKEVSFDLAKSIEYTAFVLDEPSHRKLADLAPEGWQVKSDHMTIIRPQDQREGRLPPRWLGYEGCLKIVGIAENNFVTAVLVDLGDLMLPMKGPTHPHVTIAVNTEAGGKAEMSNDFSESDYEPIEIEVCGKVEEVMR